MNFSGALDRPAQMRSARRLGSTLAVSALLALASGCGSKEAPSGGTKAAAATKAPAAVPTPDQYPTNFSPGKSTIGDIVITSIEQDFAKPQINKNSSEKTLTVGGKKFETGVGTHANSRMTITFPAGFRTLTGACGLDDDVEMNGSVLFRILSGDKVLYRSPLMKGKASTPTTFSVNVSGLTELTLIVDDAGDGNNADHADWVDLKLNK